MTKTYCGKCERELKYPEQIDIRVFSRITGYQMEMCLCAKCWDDFKEWLGVGTILRNGEEA